MVWPTEGFTTARSIKLFLFKDRTTSGVPNNLCNCLTKSFSIHVESLINVIVAKMSHGFVDGLTVPNQ